MTAFPKVSATSSSTADIIQFPNGADYGHKAESSGLVRAIALAAIGLAVFPCRARDEIDPETGEVLKKAKTPLTAHGFKDATADGNTILSWWRIWPDALVGLATGKINGIAVADFDMKDGKDWRVSAKKAGLILPVTHTVTTRGGGEHRYYRYPADVEKISSGSDLFKSLVGSKKTGIDIRGDGGYVIAWGDLSREIIATFAEWPTEVFADAMRRDDKAGEASREGRKKEAPREQSDDLERAKAALGFIPADDRDDWVKVGMALKAAFGEAGRDAWDIWSRTSNKFDARDQEAKWRSFKRDGIGLGTLFDLAKRNGWRPSGPSWSEADSSHTGAGEEDGQAGADDEPVNPAALNWAADDDFEVGPKGGVLASERNTYIALAKLGVRVSYDEFSCDILLAGWPGYGPTISDDAVASIHLAVQRHFGVKVAFETFVRMLRTWAKLNRFHPVRDYLDSVEWDGVERLDEWLTSYLGAENNELNKITGRIVLAGAVQRVRNPGCKFEVVMILEGIQYAGKSLTIASLCPKPEWFTDCLKLGMEPREIIEITAGKWLAEIGELGGMRKSDVENVKAQISRQVDEARAAYGKFTEKRPRQFIMVGTTNEAAYLMDTTGNRRFLPVKVGEIDIEALTRDRNQLWAEADYKARNGEIKIYLSKEELKLAAATQADREVVDDWLGAIQEYLDEKYPAQQDAFTVQRTTISEVAEKSKIEISLNRLDRATQMRIAAFMRKAGWEKTARTGGRNWWTRVR